MIDITFNCSLMFIYYMTLNVCGCRFHENLNVIYLSEFLKPSYIQSNNNMDCFENGLRCQLLILQCTCSLCIYIYIFRQEFRLWVKVLFFKFFPHSFKDIKKHVKIVHYVSTFYTGKLWVIWSPIFPKQGRLL